MKGCLQDGKGKLNDGGGGWDPGQAAVWKEESTFPYVSELPSGSWFLPEWPL